MFNRRVAKNDPRVEAYGTVDELNSALGIAKAFANNEAICEHLHQTQKDLVAIMGELALLPEDLPKYQEKGYPRPTEQMLQRQDEMVSHLEEQQINFKGWATPGANPAAAFLDHARTICRRAERRVVALNHGQSALSGNSLILQVLNRLADALWLMARLSEDQGAGTT